MSAPGPQAWPRQIKQMLVECLYLWAPHCCQGHSSRAPLMSAQIHHQVSACTNITLSFGGPVCKVIAQI